MAPPAAQIAPAPADWLARKLPRLGTFHYVVADELRLPMGERLLSRVRLDQCTLSLTWSSSTSPPSFYRYTIPLHAVDRGAITTMRLFLNQIFDPWAWTIVIRARPEFASRSPRKSARG